MFPRTKESIIAFWIPALVQTAIQLVEEDHSLTVLSFDFWENLPLG